MVYHLRRATAGRLAEWLKEHIYMPAKVNLVTGALAFKLERLSEFVPKLARQSIMVHFRTVWALSIPLQEHNGVVSRQEFTCIKSH